jgi:hypothetical protein
MKTALLRLIVGFRLALIVAVGLGLLGGIVLATASPSNAMDIRDELI